jgi:hypothetical protein
MSSLSFVIARRREPADWNADIAETKEAGVVCPLSSEDTLCSRWGFGRDFDGVIGLVKEPASGFCVEEISDCVVLTLSL